MQSENQAAETKANGVEGGEALRCLSCHATMIRGMRFCRLCGYRLGEGIEEFAQTRRFDGSPPPPSSARPTATAATPSATAGARAWETMTPPLAPLMSMHSPSPMQTPMRKGSRACRRGTSWGVWMIVAGVIAAAGAGSIIKINNPGRDRSGATARAPRSFSGMDKFVEADGGGAMLNSVTLPNSPAARAGLIGGDVVTVFDGQQIADDDDDLRDLIAATPVGKAVEVVYVRDGETRQTTLTTAADNTRPKSRPFAARPEGEGFLGVEADELERVAVPNTKIHGVQLGEVLENRPGHLAGLREGDIVIEFNEVPIRTKQEFLSRIDEALPGSTVKAVVMRGGERLEIPVKMGRDR